MLFVSQFVRSILRLEICCHSSLGMPSHFFAENDLHKFVMKKLFDVEFSDAHSDIQR
jgi:hypothetical protein